MRYFPVQYPGTRRRLPLFVEEESPSHSTLRSWRSRLQKMCLVQAEILAMPETVHNACILSSVGSQPSSNFLPARVVYLPFSGFLRDLGLSTGLRLRRSAAAVRSSQARHFAMAGGPAADAAPCRTLYLRGLPEKLPAATLRTLLHAAAAPHGAVLWVSAARTRALRGQAFVTFADLAGAATALRELRGTPFCGGTIEAAYALEESDRARPPPERASVKRRRREEKAAAVGSRVGGGGDGEAMELDMEVDDAAVTRTAGSGPDGANGSAEPGADADAPVEPELVVGEVNQILFAENLPAVATRDVLSDLFGRFAGFKEARTVPGRKGIAFVEFGAELDASIALSGLQGHAFEGGGTLRLTYAKK